MEEKLFDGDFFRSLKRISLWSENRLNGGRGGSRKSTAKGSSVEFSDFREYMPGDDIRRIDWNAYGRSEKLFIKLFIAGTGRNVHCRFRHKPIHEGRHDREI